MKRFLLLAVTLTGISVAAAARATVYEMTLSGLTDDSGPSFQVGGVPAPLGSAFTMRVAFENAAGTPGVYEILDVGYTLTVGSYDTVTDWATEGDLQTTVTQTGFNLSTTPTVLNPDETLRISLGFAFGDPNDPLTWPGNPVTGDIIVHGFGGFLSENQLSGQNSYTRVMSIAVVPEPALATLFLGGAAGLMRRRT